MPGWLINTLLVRIAMLWLLLAAPLLCHAPPVWQAVHFTQPAECGFGNLQVDELNTSHSLYVRSTGRQHAPLGRNLECLNFAAPATHRPCAMLHSRLTSNRCNRRATFNTTLSQFARRECTGVLVT